MMNMLSAEFYKLFRTRIFWVLISVTAGLSVITFGLLLLEEKGLLTGQVTVEAEGSLMGFDVLTESILEPETFFTYLFAAILASFFIAGEYANGTVKNIVSVGTGRASIYMAKFIATSVGTIIIFTWMVVVFSLIASVYAGLGPVPTGEVWIEVLQMYSLTILAICAFCAISTCISVVSKSSSIAIISLLGFFLVFASGLEMLGYQYTLFEKIQKGTMFYYMNSIPFVPMDAHFIWKFIVTGGLTVALFLAGGIAWFKRQDIQ